MSLARELTARHGGEWRGTYGAIPTPGHGPRDRGTTIHERPDGGVIVNCFNGEWPDARRQLGLSSEDARPMSREERIAFAKQREADAKARTARQLKQAADIWAGGAAPEPGGVVRTYLHSRFIPPAAAAMAVSRGALRERVTDRGARMMALARDPKGAPRAVQITKLRADGRGKLACDNPRITYGPMRGCAVRLLDPHDGQLAVCEGVETALAFYALHRIPAWATLGTANLQAFTPPVGLKRLYIAADGDPAGRSAAAELAKRLSASVRCIEAIAPEGRDWADVLAEKGAGRVP